jgi:hypothetical protein
MAAASASTRHLPAAWGLASPAQYVTFAAFGHTMHHGWVDYTNFTYPDPGTHVWNISKANTIVFTTGSRTLTHSMTVSRIKPTSPDSSRFYGTGASATSQPWTVTGGADWSKIWFTIRYTGADAGYRVSAHGRIAADGSVSGTARDTNNLAFSFTMPAGSAFQVLHYRASLTCAVVLRHHNARYAYTIPRYAPAGLAGLRIVAKVHDGGWPGWKRDTYAHGVATSWCNGPVTRYPITSGNIVVHR